MKVTKPLVLHTAIAQAWPDLSERFAQIPWWQPGWHSGYNEIIVSSEALNAALPASIEAFFVVTGHPTFQINDPYSHIVDMAAVHKAFLAKYHLTADIVPLLRFDPVDWESPFSPLS